MNKDSVIYVAGHTGLAGSAIIRLLNNKGYNNIIVRTSAELDLRQQVEVQQFFEKEKPEYVFMAAAKVGGLAANNTFKAEFIYDNIIMQANVIHAAYLHGVKKLLFLGSVCIYPKFAPQPLKEEYLLTGTLEPTNEPYAIAKIAGIKMCHAYRSQYNCNFISVMPCNLYGANDSYDLQNCHVLPALLRKFHEAKINNLPAVTVWGTGKPTREFMHSDDLADACLFLMLNYDDEEPINIGSGLEISIADLALIVKDTVDYKGRLEFDLEKPDGYGRRYMDLEKITELGWRPGIDIKAGVKSTYQTMLKELYK